MPLLSRVTLCAPDTRCWGRASLVHPLHLPHASRGLLSSCPRGTGFFSTQAGPEHSPCPWTLPVLVSPCSLLFSLKTRHFHLFSDKGTCLCFYHIYLGPPLCPVNICWFSLVFPCALWHPHSRTAALPCYPTRSLLRASMSPESCSLFHVFQFLEHLLKVLYPRVVWDDASLLLVSLTAGHRVRTWLMRRISRKISASVWLHFASQLLPVASAHRHYRTCWGEIANLNNS